MTTRWQIVNEARSWVGTRWHHGASLKGVGADCVGLLTGVAEACGIAEAAEYRAGNEFHGYGREPDPAVLLAACERWLERIPIAEATLADIYVMRFAEAPQHFAIVSAVDPVYIVHAYAQARRVVENRVDELWRSRIVRAYRFRGIG